MRPPGLFQLPGCDQYFDWSPGAARCCGAHSRVAVAYAGLGGVEVVGLICPRCRLVGLEKVGRLRVLGTFDLRTGEYRPLRHPEPAQPNSKELLRYFPAP